MAKNLLNSNDIIEIFSHSSTAGKNCTEVSVVRGQAGSKCPSALLFVCSEGINPIKSTISDTLENIRLGELVGEDLGPSKLNLTQLISSEHSIYYYNIKADADDPGLGAAIVVPPGYEIDSPKNKMVDILSRIFQALCHSTGGRA
jgi:hypothetical protein